MPPNKQAAIKLFDDALMFTSTCHPIELYNISILDKKLVNDPYHFFSEYIWVVYAAGFRVVVLNKLWPRLYWYFQEANPWAITKDNCDKVLTVIDHKHKYASVIKCAELVQSYDEYKDFIRAYLSGVDVMQRLPHIGKITKFHLARNLGHDVVKPDRHLVRIAEELAFSSPLELCTFIQAGRPDIRLGVIDYAFFLYESHGHDVRECCGTQSNIR